MLTRWPVFNLKLYNEKSMLYCLPSGVDSNIKEQSDEIFEATTLSSLICILIFYVILELILEPIHYCNQIPEKSNLKEVRFLGFEYQILD